MNPIKLSHLVYTIILISLFYFVPVNSHSQDVETFIIPSELANTAGNETGGPFPCFPFPSFRGQAVFLATEIGGGEIISSVNRLEPFGSGFGPVTLPNITVTLSTTQAAPGALSTTFADNIGPDATVVFQGDLTLTSPGCTTSPCPFLAGQVDFQQKFIFDPQKGNLLFDFIIPECVAGITDGDGTDQFPNIASSIVSVPFDSPTGIASNFTLVTEFTLDRSALFNVPTLSEWGLIAMAGILGIVGFMVIRRRKVTS